MLESLFLKVESMTPSIARFPSVCDLALGGKGRNAERVRFGSAR
jgi:hypothetical protein